MIIDYVWQADVRFVGVVFLLDVLGSVRCVWMLSLCLGDGVVISWRRWTVESAGEVSLAMHW
ncbi:hypothetical protein AAHH80_33105, partial [Burkholderia pseudomallei]